MAIARSHGAILLLAGVILVVVAVAGAQQRLTAKIDAEQDVAELRVRLDSVRGALASAVTATDSARLASEIRDREYYLGRREGHVAAPRPSGAPWRQPFTFGTVLFAGGVALGILGAALLVHSVRSAA